MTPMSLPQDIGSDGRGPLDAPEQPRPSLRAPRSVRDGILHAITRFQCLSDIFAERGEAVLQAMCDTDAQWMERSLAILDQPPSTPIRSFARLSVTEATTALLAARSATVYSDGGCEPNPGVGGWGILIEASSLTIELCGGDLNTTNNRMEMTAAIVALSVLPLTCSTTIVSDSQYLVKGMTLWMDGWQRKNFRKGGNPIPNADLWIKLNLLSKGRWVQWRWVRGHNGHAGNERADELATEGRLAVERASRLADFGGRQASAR